MRSPDLRRRCLPGLVALAGCTVGSGEVLEENRSVGDFTAIRTSGPVDVELSVDASSTTLRVRCDDNLLEELATTVESGVLVVEFTRAVAPRVACRVVSGQFVLASLTSTGGGDIVASGPLAAVQLVSSTGSGHVELRADPGATSPATPELVLERGGTGDLVVEGLDVGSLQVDHTGAGHVELAGQAQSLLLSASGSGWLDAVGLPGLAGTLLHSGPGRMSATLSESAVVENAGDGDVLVYGRPPVREVAGSGRGRVVFP